MDVLPDSPPPTLRGVYLTFATMVGFLGILLLAGYSFAVYQADSLASLGFLFPLAIFGVAAMVVCGLMLFGANSDNTWGFNVAAIVSIFVIPALFLLVVGPLAERHCMLRHMEEMEQRIPL